MNIEQRVSNSRRWASCGEIHHSILDIRYSIFLVLFAVNAFAGPASIGVIKTDIVTASVEQQYEAVQPGSKSALAVHFDLKKDWHFYASARTAPGGMNLKIKPSAENLSFSHPIFPQPKLHFDKFSGKKLEVFSNRFTVFLPFSVELYLPRTGRDSVDVRVGVEGAVCSDVQCRMPDFGQLSTKVRITGNAAMSEPKFSLPDLQKSAQEAKLPATGQWTSYSAWFALGLALLAGLTLNIMPCVWPVLPLIVMRIVEQAKESKSKSTALGLAFCLGILLFFACLAGANIILQLFYGTVLQWGDQFRSPAFVAGMVLLLVALALFMFGVFNITLPSAIAGKSGSGKGHFGAVGMGFLAAILSTPCSFAILAAAFAWAQARPLPLGTLAIMVIGVGMAVPYALLTSMPGLLSRLPKPGRWMELFKQTIGFVLLIIAVKLIAALPQTRRMDVLYFAVVLSFCLWMWGGWVSPITPRKRKWIIRIIAVAIAVTAGLWLLPEPKTGGIDWQQHDTAMIEQARGQRPVLIEFMADWCLTCKAVEKTVYSRRDIAELIERKGVLAIKADTTLADYPATVALKNIYNEPGVPVTILLVPARAEPARLHGLLIGGRLKKLLQDLPDRD